MGLKISSVIVGLLLGNGYLSLTQLDGCEDDDDDTETPTETPAPVDNDNDGYTTTDGDCDDNDSSIHPSAIDTAFDGIDQDCSGSDETTKFSLGDEWVVYVDSEDIGNVAIRLTAPLLPRYSDGAPIIADIPTFFTPSAPSFKNSVDANGIGAMLLAYLWPGTSDPSTGASSDGTYDYGGETSISALKDVLQFATGDLPNTAGYYIDEMADFGVLTNNVGLYAFSHPGIAATNVMAHYGEYLTNIKYFVGRENPTTDTLNCMEIGYWADDGTPEYNPYYNYPEDYTPTNITLPYEEIGWIQNETYPEGSPFFYVDGTNDHILGSKVPTMYGKRFYSAKLTQALLDNGALSLDSWPPDLATPEEAESLWPYRTTVNNYGSLYGKATQLKVMLVFSENDHVQVALDKPHIHQAYTGFTKGSKLSWVRLNPDREYVKAMNSTWYDQFPDNTANTEPSNWSNVKNWSYPSLNTSSTFVPMAAISEMADRTYYDNWSTNLATVLHTY